jgi:hypothetical protein
VRVHMNLEPIDSVSIYVSPKRDLAFIKVPGSGYPYLRLASPASIGLADEVVSERAWKPNGKKCARP